MSTDSSPDGPKWKSLNSRQRRVLGVLVEKAKTTPDAYPMTINGIVTGSNQKSNREPQMNLSADDAEQVLDELRALGVVTEVQGSGRVPKYRHHAYEWLGVDKTELAVMTELLLRGEQTLGELRARAGRMEPIADQAALRPVVESLLAKKLMIELTPPGRGQMVSHNLYKDRELVELRAQLAGYTPPADDSESDRPAASTPPPARVVVSSSPAAAAPSAAPAQKFVTPDELSEVVVDVTELRAEVARLKDQVSALATKLESLMS